MCTEGGKTCSDLGETPGVRYAIAQTVAYSDWEDFRSARRAAGFIPAELRSLGDDGWHAFATKSRKHG
jgi:hypothetical protein